MFEKKDIIFSETLGVCQVAELTRLSAKNGEQVMYYGLKSIEDKKKVSYIPVENHQVQLRPLITYDEAKQLEQGDQAQLSDLQKKEIQYVLTYKR
ncbi:MAG: CarD-like/TRCF domain protein [Lachnospiraceae bacterium]|nr:CarD-like/TRCF domain protein [Lachnospiraceae bacterium]